MLSVGKGFVLKANSHEALVICKSLHLALLQIAMAKYLFRMFCKETKYSLEFGNLLSKLEWNYFRKWISSHNTSLNCNLAAEFAQKVNCLQLKKCNCLCKCK